LISTKCTEKSSSRERINNIGTEMATPITDISDEVNPSIASFPSFPSYCVERVIGDQ